MSLFTLRLLEDRLEPGGHSAALPATNRVVYVFSGSATVEGAEAPAMLAENQAWHGALPVGIKAGPEGAVILRFELVADPGKDDGLAKGITSRHKLSAPIDLDPAGDYLMRCDRVDFLPGGVAYTHVHQGPGIRCLACGEFSVTTGGKTMDFLPLGPWFESGSEPVYAAGAANQPSAFVRVMVLPARLKGQSSIRYVNPEDKDKPRSQKYSVFIDELIKI